MKTVELKLVSWHRDNGDGSNSVVFYNSEEQLDEELKAEAAEGLGETTLEQIKSGDDPYEYGTLSTAFVVLQVDETTGGISLGQSFCVSSD